MLYQSTIPKKKPATEAAFDWRQLYDLGLKHVQRLSSRIWTDYNVHDPGVTILELLCYTLTDLSYRASFPVEDILAAAKDNADHMAEQFFTARQILPTRPLTVLDYRKLLIDLPGVQNAWIQPVDLSFFADPPTVDPGKRKLRQENPNLPGVIEIRPAGLYDVTLDFTPEVVTPARKNDIKEQARQLLARNRTLCEDFRDIGEIAGQSFILCAEVQLAPEADSPRVKAEIFFRLQQHLAPPVNRYSLSDMLARRAPDGTMYTADKIFDGPPLDHGFIDDAELEQAELRSEIRLSDLISIIMDIPGVQAVRQILFTPTDAPPPVNHWVIPVRPGRKALLQTDSSRLILSKRQMPVVPKAAEVERHLRELREAARLNPEVAGLNDFPIPLGEHRELDDYQTFQHHFPAVYGLSPFGLNPAAGPARQALARQLKAYLLFFDQLMADYLAQLSHVRELFSLNPDLPRTYYYREVKNFSEIYANSQVQETIEQHVDDPTCHLPRRQRFLDHLIARFAERFHDYAAIMSEVLQAGPETLVAHKCAFLQEYDQLSLDRPLAYNYRLQQATALWDSANVSGLEKRLAKLLGLPGAHRRNLSPGSEPVEGMYLIENILLLPEDPGDPLLPIPGEADNQDGAGLDPYSYRLHLILPAFAGRFRTMEFRRFAESVIRAEIPAHILPKICWIDQDDMEMFQEKYRAWIFLKAGVKKEERQQKLASFLEALFSLQSVYDSRPLHECREGEEEPQLFIVGRNTLGSLPPEDS